MKSCSKCGVIKPEDDFIKCVRNKSGTGACKTCNSSYYYTKKNSIKFIESRKKYYNKNRKTILSYKKQWAEKNDTIEKKLQRDQKNRDQLTPGYIKRRLRRVGFTNNIINTYPELLEVYKILIKTKRLCKSQTSTN